MTAKMAKVSSKTKSPAASGTVRTASAEASMADQPPAATDAIETAGDADDAMQMSDDEEGGTRIGDIYIPPSVKPYCSTESIGPRLVITRIVNENFKSYAGEVTLGPFFHRFHSVIGPNGSGKSNVIDSMLFVFGYRAKQIRCQKLSTLLHNSAAYPNICSCKVAVHFQTIVDAADGSATAQPGTEFFISRTAFKDNSSFYTINDRRVHFKEVGKLLKSHGVDLDHNRFLILQGEVESIAMMKPKALTPNESGLLEYFEDIIGTSRYKEPLLRINERVESLTEELIEKRNRCKIAERDMKELQAPKQAAIEYLEQENVLTRNVNLHVQKYLSEQQLALVELGAERLEHKEAVKQHDAKFAALAEQRTAKEATIREERQRYDVLAKQKLSMETELKQSLNKFAEIQSAMEATNKRRKDMRAQRTKEEAALVDLRLVPERNAVEVKESEKRMEKLEKKRAAEDAQLQANLETLEAETRPVLAERERLETELIGLRQTVNECRAAVKLAESELRLCTDAETVEQRKYETFRLAFEDAKVAVDEKTERVKVVEEEMVGWRGELVAKEKTLTENVKREQELVQQVRKKRADLEEITRNAQQASSNNKVLNALMQQKQEGRIPGVLGRLGDLGAIDAKYDVAVSTCCGRLDNIVVDTVDTAQECIAYLKRANVGRATFIALEKVAHCAQIAAQRIQTPENAPRLYDLIRVEDERVSAAFYFSLGDTLVANDLDQGTRIAYGAQRYRVVSLRGDVIETSGTMSGGGNSQMRGRMGQQVKQKSGAAARHSVGAASGADIEKMRDETRQLQDEVNFLQEQQGHLERDIGQLQQRLRQAEAELKRLRLDVASLRQHLPRQEQQVAQQRQIMDATKADAGRKAELQAQLDDNQTRLAEAEKNSKVIADKVDATKKRIKEITGERVGQLEKRIAEVDKQLAALKKNVLKLNVEIGTSERNVTKTEAKIESLNTDIQQAEEQLRADNAERSRIERVGVELTVKIEETAQQLAAASSESSETKREIDALAKQEADGKLARLELAQQLQTVDKKIAEVEGSLPHWRNKLQPLRLNVIPINCADSEEQLAQNALDETEGRLVLKTYTAEELAGYKLEDLQYKISYLEETLRSQKVDLSVIEQFFRKQLVYLDRVTAVQGITKKRDVMSKVYEEVRMKRFHEFLHGFGIISKRLREMYQMITQGGDAELELIDSLDPFTEGVSFSVRPPKKSWKNISNLSGGEKTLSSLALVFALHYYKPSPLYFMDEIDAALDFKNVSIVANYIKSRTKNAQFIIISLRANMFELSDCLTGIYKVSDCTQSVTIRNDQLPWQSAASGVVTSTQMTEPVVVSQSIVNDPRVEEISMIGRPTQSSTQPSTQQNTQQGLSQVFDEVRRRQIIAAQEQRDLNATINELVGDGGGSRSNDDVSDANVTSTSDMVVDSSQAVDDCSSLVVNETMDEDEGGANSTADEEMDTHM